MTNQDNRIELLQAKVKELEATLRDFKQELNQEIERQAFSAAPESPPEYRIKWIGDIYVNNSSVDASKTGHYVWRSSCFEEYQVVEMPILNDETLLFVNKDLEIISDEFYISSFTHVSNYSTNDIYLVQKYDPDTRIYVAQEYIASDDIGYEDDERYSEALLSAYLEQKQLQDKGYQRYSVDPVYVSELTDDDVNNFFFVDEKRSDMYFCTPSQKRLVTDGQGEYQTVVFYNMNEKLRAVEKKLDEIVYRILE